MSLLHQLENNDWSVARTDPSHARVEEIVPYVHPILSNHLSTPTSIESGGIAIFQSADLWGRAFSQIGRHTLMATPFDPSCVDLDTLSDTVSYANAVNVPEWSLKREIVLYRSGVQSWLCGGIVRYTNREASFMLDVTSFAATAIADAPASLRGQMEAFELQFSSGQRCIKQINEANIESTLAHYVNYHLGSIKRILVSLKRKRQREDTMGDVAGPEIPGFQGSNGALLRQPPTIVDKKTKIVEAAQLRLVPTATIDGERVDIFSVQGGQTFEPMRQYVRTVMVTNSTTRIDLEPVDGQRKMPVFFDMNPAVAKTDQSFEAARQVFKVLRKAVTRTSILKGERAQNVDPSLPLRQLGDPGKENVAYKLDYGRMQDGLKDSVNTLLVAHPPTAADINPDDEDRSKIVRKVAFRLPHLLTVSKTGMKVDEAARSVAQYAYGSRYGVSVWVSCAYVFPISALVDTDEVANWNVLNAAAEPDSKLSAARGFYEDLLEATRNYDAVPSPENKRVLEGTQQQAPGHEDYMRSLGTTLENDHAFRNGKYGALAKPTEPINTPDGKYGVLFIVELMPTEVGKDPIVGTDGTTPFGAMKALEEDPGFRYENKLTRQLQSIWRLLVRMSAVGIMQLDAHLGNVLLNEAGDARVIDFDERMSTVLSPDELGGNWMSLFVLNTLMMSAVLSNDPSRVGLVSHLLRTRQREVDMQAAAERTAATVATGRYLHFRDLVERVRKRVGDGSIPSTLLKTTWAPVFRPLEAGVDLQNVDQQENLYKKLFNANDSGIMPHFPTNSELMTGVFKYIVYDFFLVQPANAVLQMWRGRQHALSFMLATYSEPGGRFIDESEIYRTASGLTLNFGEFKHLNTQFKTKISSLQGTLHAVVRPRPGGGLWMDVLSEIALGNRTSCLTESSKAWLPPRNDLRQRPWLTFPPECYTLVGM